MKKQKKQILNQKKTGSLPRKLIKNISQNKKNSLKIFHHKDSNILNEQ